MTFDRTINLLAGATLVEMMFTVGLGVPPVQLRGALRDIAADSFPETSSITPCALFQALLIALVAVVWGCLTPDRAEMAESVSPIEPLACPRCRRDGHFGCGQLSSRER